MKIKYENEILEIDREITVHDLFVNKVENFNDFVVACKYNNEVKSLNTIIKEECDIKLVDLTSRDGMRIYARGLTFIMAMVFKECYPESKVFVKYQLGDAIYCEAGNIVVTDDVIEKVKNRMKEIVAEKIPFIKKQISKEEARKLFEDEDVGRLELIEYRERDYISVYYCKNYFNSFYGVMPLSTEPIKKFDLNKYHNGFIIRYSSNFSNEELPPYRETKKLFNTFNEYEDIHDILDVGKVSQLNKIIENGQIGDLIRTDEALHEKKIANIADMIAENKELKLVLISGPSSSGKTTFAQRLGMQLKINGLKPVTISLDNYFVDRDKTPLDEFGKYDFESVNAIDLELFNSQLTSLLNGEEIELPEFDFKDGSRKYNGNKLKMEKNTILVVEGIHGLNELLTSSVAKKNKFKIYISALTVLNVDDYNRISSTDSRILRRLVRDNNFRGHSALNTLKMWYSIRRGEEKYIFPYQEDADAMFNTSLVYEMGVLKKHAYPLLSAIESTEDEYSEAKRLCELLSYFKDIPEDEIPATSIIKEFVGGGCFRQ